MVRQRENKSETNLRQQWQQQCASNCSQATQQDTNHVCKMCARCTHKHVDVDVEGK